jgi:hypothetical protein
VTSPKTVSWIWPVHCFPSQLPQVLHSDSQPDTQWELSKYWLSYLTTQLCDLCPPPPPRTLQ